MIISLKRHFAYICVVLCSFLAILSSTVAKPSLGFTLPAPFANLPSISTLTQEFVERKHAEQMKSYRWAPFLRAFCAALFFLLFFNFFCVARGIMKPRATDQTRNTYILFHERNVIFMYYMRWEPQNESEKLRIKLKLNTALIYFNLYNCRWGQYGFCGFNNSSLYFNIFSVASGRQMTHWWWCIIMIKLWLLVSASFHVEYIVFFSSVG